METPIEDPAAPAPEPSPEPSSPPIAPSTPPLPSSARSQDILNILIVLATLGIFFGAAFFLYRFLSKEKHFMVRIVQAFDGNSQPCGIFDAWDLVTLPGKMALTDQPRNRILLFDQDGKFLKEIRQQEAGPPAFRELSGMTSDPSGDLYVIDCWNGLIRGFTPDGYPLPIIDLQNKGFYGPRNIAWTDNAFFVSDTGSHRIVRVSSQGAVLDTWGHRGKEDDQLDNPGKMEFDADMNFYISDQSNRRLLSWNSAGLYRWSVKMDQIASGMALDEGHKVLYISEDVDGRAKAVNLDGKVLGTLTNIGHPDEPMQGLNILRVRKDGVILAKSRGEIVMLEPMPDL